MTRKQEQDKRRSEFLKKLIAFIESEGDEAIQIKKNEVAFPIVFNNGDEAFMKVAVSIPAGSRDGDIFDAYSLHEEFEINEKKTRRQKDKKKRRKRKLSVTKNNARRINS